jgi:hypothetical protein
VPADAVATKEKNTPAKTNQLNKSSRLPANAVLPHSRDLVNGKLDFILPDFLADDAAEILLAILALGRSIDIGAAATRDRHGKLRLQNPRRLSTRPRENTANSPLRIPREHDLASLK